jgi:Activator of Hsp90 ATPase homolog 1-like protein
MRIGETSCNFNAIDTGDRPLNHASDKGVFKIVDPHRAGQRRGSKAGRDNQGFCWRLLARKWAQRCAFDRGRLRLLANWRNNWRERPMANSRFVYMTYIRPTPENLWQALIDPEFTRQYWMEARQESGWKPGASWQNMIPHGRIADSGEILEIEPPRKARADLAQ